MLMDDMVIVVVHHLKHTDVDGRCGYCCSSSSKTLTDVDGQCGCCCSSSSKTLTDVDRLCGCCCSSSSMTFRC